MTTNDKSINIEYHTYAADAEGDVAIMHKTYLINKLLFIIRRNIEQPSYRYNWNINVIGEKSVIAHLERQLLRYEDTANTVSTYTKTSHVMDLLLKLKHQNKIIYVDDEFIKCSEEKKANISHTITEVRGKELNIKAQSIKNPRAISICIPYMFRMYIRPHTGVSNASCEAIALNYINEFMALESILDADVIIDAPYFTDAFSSLGANMYVHMSHEDPKTYILTDPSFRNTLAISQKMNGYFDSIHQLHELIANELEGNKDLTEAFDAYYNKFMSEFNVKPAIDIEEEPLVAANPGMFDQDE